MSKGLVLERFFHLLNGFREYLSQRDSLPSNVAVVQTRLRNSMWIEKVAFLTDITAHLNKLNLELQGKNMVISNMFTGVTSLKTNCNCLYPILVPGN